MPTEVKRQRARKKVILPSGDFVYIPVITQISFVDQNGQETQCTPENTSDGNREVHVDQVSSSHVDGSINVERIDTWKVKDIPDKAQETNFEFDNVTGNGTRPPSFINHQKTHIYRYYKNPGSPDNNGSWIDSELIDEFRILDQRGFEEQWTLENPAADDTIGQASPDDPDITDAILDPPYRTDPFQNIVDFNDQFASTSSPGVTPYHVFTTGSYSPLSPLFTLPSYTFETAEEQSLANHNYLVANFPGSVLPGFAITTLNVFHLQESDIEAAASAFAVASSANHADAYMTFYYEPHT